MSNNFQVGEKYKPKTYLESGYKFPEGKYKIKAIVENFPKKNINYKDELIRAKNQWLEEYEDNKEEYDKLYNSLWYYVEFPDSNEDRFEWIPEVIMETVFLDESDWLNEIIPHLELLENN